jgi:hypothetical protein
LVRLPVPFEASVVIVPFVIGTSARAVEPRSWWRCRARRTRAVRSTHRPETGDEVACRSASSGRKQFRIGRSTWRSYRLASGSGSDRRRRRGERHLGEQLGCGHRSQRVYRWLRASIEGVCRPVRDSRNEAGGAGHATTQDR